MCSYLFHQRCIQNCYVSLQCLKSALDVFFCFWHLRRVRKKKKISRLMMQCYLLFVHYLSQRLCFQIKKQRKKTKKKLIKRGLTYMYHYHVQVFFTFSGHAQRHFLSEFYLFIIFFQCRYFITIYFSSWSNFWKYKSISRYMQYIIHFISFLFLIYPRVCRMAKLSSPEAFCIFWPSLPYKILILNRFWKMHK